MIEKGKSIFSRRNFAGLQPPFENFKTAKVVILPVPYDSTTEWLSGAREGPRATIDASQFLELYDLELGKEIYRVGIHTLPEVEPLMGSPGLMIERVYKIARNIIKKGKILVMIGGEHSLTLGVVKAFKESFKELSVLQLDAHADLRAEYQGTIYSHACVMRRVFELCPIVQVGIRSLSQEEVEFSGRDKLHSFYRHALLSAPSSLEKIVSSLGQNVYVTIDLDVFDPSLMPAVSSPEPGGMVWDEVLQLLKYVASQKSIVGFDIVELCPKEGPVSCAFLAAKLVYKLIGYIVTSSPRVVNG